MPTQRLSGDDVDTSAFWNGIGVVGLLALTYWLLATDRLITGRAHEREIAAKDAQLASNERIYEQRIADKDAQIVMWRAVGETSQAQSAELLEHSRLSVQLLQAIERRAQEQQAREKGPGS
jgi:hypothetical protein